MQKDKPSLTVQAIKEIRMRIRDVFYDVRHSGFEEIKDYIKVCSIATEEALIGMLLSTASHSRDVEKAWEAIYYMGIDDIVEFYANKEKEDKKDEEGEEHEDKE